MFKDFLFCSDWHLSNKYPYSSVPHPYKDRFFLAAYSAAKQVVDYAIENNCVLIHGGDLLDKEKISSPEYAIVKSLFSKLNRNKIDTYINLGNHEIEYLSGIPSIMRSISNAYQFINTPDPKKRYTIFNYEGVNICMIPYYIEGVFNEVLLEACKEIKDSAILVIHQNIKGIQLGKTKLMEGLNQKELMYKVKDKFKLIINGHLHFANIIKGIPSIVIPGSTCSVDFKDLNSIKSFYVYRCDENCNFTLKDVVPIKDQIYFKEYYISDKIANAKNSFIKLYTHGEDYSNLEKELLNDGAVAVQIEEIQDNAKVDLSDYARPLEMSINDWLKIWLEDKIDDEEIINPLMKLNEEIFNG